jgi:hypothetical protein
MATTATNLGPLFTACRRPDPAPIPPAPPGTPALEQPIWHGMVAEFGWPAEGVPWTPALAELVDGLHAATDLVVVAEETETTPLTLRAVPA